MVIQKTCESLRRPAETFGVAHGGTFSDWVCHSPSSGSPECIFRLTGSSCPDHWQRICLFVSVRASLLAVGITNITVPSEVGLLARLAPRLWVTAPNACSSRCIGCRVSVAGECRRGWRLPAAGGVTDVSSTPEEIISVLEQGSGTGARHCRQSGMAAEEPTAMA